MDIDSFPTEFTNDLESFVKNPIQFNPITVWDERRVAAPERHFANGLRESFSPTTIAFLLEQHNPAFQKIEDMLQLFFQSDSYTANNTIEHEKEQCWLFGWKWLDIYYNLLLSPNILKSVFYKYDNNRFLSLLHKLLHPEPSQRSKFRDVLEVWYPDSALLKPVEFAIFDTDTTAIPPPTLPVEIPPVKKRLVIKACEENEGLKKTRKNNSW
jgi:hypothetical protein